MAKRESNAERTAREHDRRTTLQMANLVAGMIHSRRNSKLDLAPEHSEDLPAKELKRFGWHPESKRWREKYTFLGQVFCEICPFDRNPAEFLRMVADSLEGKKPHSPGDIWNDAAITSAYGQACRRMPPPHLIQGVYSDNRPSFLEFLHIFREKNPKLKGASERSLRRSLKRLGYHTRPGKPGRPKINRDRKARPPW
jgi:hypothetical protein